MRPRALLLLFAWLVLDAPRPAGAAVEIVDADEVRSRIVVRDGTATLDVDGVRWELLTDPAAPGLSSLGDGAFHPMDRDEIEAALAQIRGAGKLPDARVWILPFPRSKVLRSSCHGSTILLSPGIRPVAAEHVHMTVVHEMGHVLEHALDAHQWETYRRLRDLDPARHHPGASHPDRPAEIFAEDFRYLMGGPLATASGQIENADLPTPDRIPGLRLWFHRRLLSESPDASPGRLAPSSFPNPFRVGRTGSAAIRFAAPSGDVPNAPARVFDLRGRLVRELRGEPDGDGVVFRWDGRDGGGRRVATGAYFVRWAPQALAGAVHVQILR